MNVKIQQSQLKNTMKYMQFKIYILNIEDSRKLPNLLND